MRPPCLATSAEEELVPGSVGVTARQVSRQKDVEVMPGFIVANDETGFRDMARSKEFERILKHIAQVTAASTVPNRSIPRSLRYEGD